MTRDGYYKILKERWDKVDKNNLDEIKAYNVFARALRKDMICQDEQDRKEGECNE